ncbi:hypothetical protein NQ314_018573 [Rhamnusium bicolor]|uniref:Uncharacterized protein n=1 Tax=Rhamnusium bicolor TaxID=1586634 RepID=A0AAV8WRB9_9CUCU|nr:hypothetical protein NQ314_018573 [Rhamnusium bicolor]
MISVEHIPEAIATNCAKCNDAQVTIIRKTSSYIMENQPDDWEKIKNKFDPKEKYTESFNQFIKGN